MQQNQAVMNGWDVVFNLLVEPVNEYLAHEFEHSVPEVWKNLDVTYCVVTPNPLGSGNIVTYHELSAQLAAPAVQFGGANDAVVAITFAASGEFKTASVAAPAGFTTSDCNPDQPGLEWKTQSLANTTMTGVVPLSVLTGTVLTDLSTVIDLPAGTFSFPDIPPDHADPDSLSSQISAFFASHAAQLVIGTLAGLNTDCPVGWRTTDGCPQFKPGDAMMPQSFRLNTLTTDSGKNILQLFVTTVGTAPQNLTLDVNEPIPDGYGASIMTARSLEIMNPYWDGWGKPLAPINRSLFNLMNIPILKLFGGSDPWRSGDYLAANVQFLPSDLLTLMLQLDSTARGLDPPQHPPEPAILYPSTEEYASSAEPDD